VRAAGCNPIAAASHQPSATSHQLAVLGASRLGPILSADRPKFVSPYRILTEARSAEHHQLTAEAGGW